MIHCIYLYFQERRRILCDQGLARERRIFAGLELFCFPASWLTLLVILPLRILSAYTGHIIPVWTDRLLDILLSAAVGYITNYIAVEMLFKPYQQQKWHPLSILTLGYWKQGLVPRNKNRIGEELGNQIEKKLLNPEEMADELCTMATALFQNRDVIKSFCSSVKELLLKHENQIVEFLLPHIEESLRQSLMEIITRERFLHFLDMEILPRLKDVENRKIITRYLTDAFQKRSPELTDSLKKELGELVFDYLNGKLPFGFGADVLADGLTACINWAEIERRIRWKLGEESTHEMLQEELSALFDKTENWLQSPEAAAKIKEMEQGFRQYILVFVHQYLQNRLACLVDRAIASKTLWEWVENGLFPSFQPGLEKFIREQGKDKIAVHLKLANRVALAVQKQDVREFHEMVNSLAAQHLGAIQVLGYFLGGVVGFIQIFT